MSQAKSIGPLLQRHSLKMGVIEHAIEFIYEAACNKVFAEDNWIGKGRRRSLRENRDLEVQNVLNWK